MQQLDEILNEGETSRDAARAEERGGHMTAMREGVVFEEEVEEGTDDFDGDIALFHGCLTELVSSLNIQFKNKIGYMYSNHGNHHTSYIAYTLKAIRLC